MRKDKTKISDSVQKVTESYIAKKISTNKKLKRIKQDLVLMDHNTKLLRNKN